MRPNNEDKLALAFGVDEQVSLVFVASTRIRRDRKFGRRGRNRKLEAGNWFLVTRYWLLHLATSFQLLASSNQLGQVCRCAYLRLAVLDSTLKQAIAYQLHGRDSAWSIWRRRTAELALRARRMSYAEWLRAGCAAAGPAAGGPGARWESKPFPSRHAELLRRSRSPVEGARARRAPGFTLDADPDHGRVRVGLYPCGQRRLTITDGVLDGGSADPSYRRAGKADFALRVDAQQLKFTGADASRRRHRRRSGAFRLRQRPHCREFPDRPTFRATPSVCSSRI